MKAGFTTLAKLLAICVSLSLLGGYIWYRQEQARQDQVRRDLAEKAQANRSTLTEAQLKAIDEAWELAGKNLEGESEFTGPLEPNAIMSSSKSPTRVVMPSSKVSTAGLRSGDFAIVGNTIDAILAGGKEGQEKAADKPEGEERTILPGSKSGGVDVGEVPLLEDIPIVGPLFRGEAKESQAESSDE